MMHATWKAKCIYTYVGLQDIFTSNRKVNIKDVICGDFWLFLDFILLIARARFYHLPGVLVFETCNYWQKVCIFVFQKWWPSYGPFWREYKPMLVVFYVFVFCICIIFCFVIVSYFVFFNSVALWWQRATNFVAESQRWNLSLTSLMAGVVWISPKTTWFAI